MKVIPGSLGRRPSAPVAEIDPDKLTATIMLFALGCWPRDARMRGEALVTWAAQFLAVIDLGLPPDRMAALVEASLQKAAAIKGVTVDELSLLPHVPEIANQAIAFPDELRVTIDKELFRPGGGWQAMANAAYSGDIGNRFKQSSMAGTVAGLVVLYAAIIDQFHAPVIASYNRSMHIIDHLVRMRRINVAGDRERRRAWIEWRGVGHIWAANLLAIAVDEATGSTGEIYKPGQGVRRVMGWATWFRIFATTHQPPGARAPLVPDHEAVAFSPAVEAVKPPLTPLQPDVLQAVLGYRAPVPSQ